MIRTMTITRETGETFTRENVNPSSPYTAVAGRHHGDWCEAFAALGLDGDRGSFCEDSAREYLDGQPDRVHVMVTKVLLGQQEQDDQGRWFVAREYPATVTIRCDYR